MAVKVKDEKTAIDQKEQEENSQDKLKAEDKDKVDSQGEYATKEPSNSDGAQ